MAEQVNSDRSDVDNDINDLAETAMDVTGRIRLGGDAARDLISPALLSVMERWPVTIGERFGFVIDMKPSIR